VLARCSIVTFCLQTITTLHAIIAYLNKSTYTQEHYDYQRSKLGITHSIENPGETRFGSNFWSGVSIQRGLPAFRALAKDEALGIEIPVRIISMHAINLLIPVK
jgi:hypothetical protein